MFAIIGFILFALLLESLQHLRDGAADMSTGWATGLLGICFALLTFQPVALAFTRANEDIGVAAIARVTRPFFGWVIRRRTKELRESIRSAQERCENSIRSISEIQAKFLKLERDLQEIRIQPLPPSVRQLLEGLFSQYAAASDGECQAFDRLSRKFAGSGDINDARRVFSAVRIDYCQMRLELSELLAVCESHKQSLDAAMARASRAAPPSQEEFEAAMAMVGHDYLWVTSSSGIPLAESDSELSRIGGSGLDGPNRDR